MVKKQPKNPNQAEVQNLLVSATRDCAPRDRSSFIELQSNTGVEIVFIC